MESVTKLLAELTDDSELNRVRKQRGKTDVMYNIDLAVKKPEKAKERHFERLQMENESCIWRDPVRIKAEIEGRVDVC